MQADREGEEQHVAAADRAQQQLQEKLHTLEQVKAASPAPHLCLTRAPPVPHPCLTCASPVPHLCIH